MLKIRLMKPGKSVKGRHNFRIVVMDVRRARDSSFTDQLGYYDPSQKLLKIDLQKYQKWIKQGSQPTKIVATLAKRYKKILEADKAIG